MEVRWVLTRTLKGSEGKHRKSFKTPETLKFFSEHFRMTWKTFRLSSSSVWLTYLWASLIGWYISSSTSFSSPGLFTPSSTPSTSSPNQPEQFASVQVYSSTATFVAMFWFTDFSLGILANKLQEPNSGRIQLKPKNSGKISNQGGVTP